MMLVIIVLLIIVLLIGYMYYKAFADKVTYETINSTTIPEAFYGYKLFFIADVHWRKIKSQTLHSIKEKVDIVLIGGDLVERGVPLERMRENIIKLKGWNVPVYFVWGNNDYKADYVAIRKILLEEGIFILEDDIVQIERQGAALNLIGFDYYSDQDKLPEIKWQAVSSRFTLLLTHTPNSFFRLPAAAKDKIDIALAGHTHGGQIRFFRLGLDIKGGYYQDNQSSLFISEGYGYRLIPLRFQTQAQCHIICLQSS